MPAPTILTLPLVDGPDDLDRIEAVDAQIRRHVEYVDIGPLPNTANTYLRVAAGDLFACAEALRRLADRIIDTVADARMDALDAELVACPSCPTLIGPDDHTCGSPGCQRLCALDSEGLS